MPLGSYHGASSEKKLVEDLDPIKDSSYIVINTPVKLIGRRMWEESRVLKIKLNHQPLEKPTDEETQNVVSPNSDTNYYLVNAKFIKITISRYTQGLLGGKSKEIFMKEFKPTLNISSTRPNIEQPPNIEQLSLKRENETMIIKRSDFLDKKTIALTEKELYKYPFVSYNGTGSWFVGNFKPLFQDTEKDEESTLEYLTIKKKLLWNTLVTILEQNGWVGTTNPAGGNVKISTIRNRKKYFKNNTKLSKKKKKK